jgi:tRNA(adenine34) deaminase
MTDFMQIAIEQARIAARKGEVPVGAVIVCNGKVIAKAHNRRERTQNALAHAEVLAIARGCKKLRSWRLDNCEMYVTLEPCAMCMGAIINARIKKVVFGAQSQTDLNWKVETHHIPHEECSKILKQFFSSKRD